jgi:LysR family transcriptional regulator, flagellar master operon regulator
VDITLARTFLAICDVGNFVKAAEQLYVTQSTVSTRVKLLEDLLGQPLFQRNKSGATLTPSGTQFKPFAEKLIQTWEQARQEVGLPEDYKGVLSIGTEFTLWERLLTQWIPWIKTSVPDLALRVSIGNADYLSQQLMEGLLDLAVTYTPHHRPGLTVENLAEEDLVLISSNKQTEGPWEEEYIYVDWGPEFRLEHMEAFPNTDPATLVVDYGPLALQEIVTNGGAAYLPIRLVKSRIDDGSLFLVDAPAFPRSLFVVYLETEDNQRYQTALQGLRYVISTESET